MKAFRVTRLHTHPGTDARDAVDRKWPFYMGLALVLQADGDSGLPAVERRGRELLPLS